MSHYVLDAALLVGLILFVLGLVKRRSRWGTAVAIVGAALFMGTLVLHYPNLAEAFRTGFEEGQADAQSR